MLLSELFTVQNLLLSGKLYLTLSGPMGAGQVLVAGLLELALGDGVALSQAAQPSPCRGGLIVARTSPRPTVDPGRASPEPWTA